MNCEQCLDLISDLMDASLPASERATLLSHLDECLSCADVRSQMETIVGFCRIEREAERHLTALPNEQALWRRVSNVLESEKSYARPAPPVSRPASNESWFARFFNRSWELSLPQAVMAIAAITVIAGLATAIGLRGWRGGINGNAASGNAFQSDPNFALTGSNRADELLKRREMAMSYWNQRIQERKKEWNPQMRADFEHNVAVLDEAVSEASKHLLDNPQDEFSAEMLEVALDDKMKLMQEFSKL